MAEECPPEAIVFGPDNPLVQVVAPQVDVAALEVPELAVLVEQGGIPAFEAVPPADDPTAVVALPGPAGPAGDGATELYDSPTTPDSPPSTYLRFERDLDGDVQAIYLGTTT